MAREQVTFDHADEASGAPYTVDRPDDGIEIMEHAYPSAERERVYAGNADTEGDLVADGKYKNAAIELIVRLFGAGMRARATEVQQKVGKMSREGGTYRRTLKDGSWQTYDILDAEITEFPADWMFLQRDSVVVKMRFERRPLARLAPYTVGPFTETVNPELIFTVDNVPGDAPALGKLTITDGDGVDQQWAVWGQQSRYLDTNANAALVFPTSGRTPQGAGAAASNPAMPGTGNNVIRATLNRWWRGIFSTQAPDGSHHRHRGRFRLLALVSQTGPDPIDIRVVWSQGDLRTSTPNSRFTLPANILGPTVVDLGVVDLPGPLEGQDRWQARVEGRTSVAETGTDTIDVGRYWLVPTDEGWGEASGAAMEGGLLATPTDYILRDPFNQAGGALAGQNAEAGGAWGAAGAASGWTVNATAKTAERAAANDVTPNGGARAIGGPAALAGQAIQGNVMFPSRTSARTGFVLRHIDSNNFVAVTLCRPPSPAVQYSFSIIAMIDGELSEFTAPVGVGSILSDPLGLFAAIDASGNYIYAVYGPNGSQVYTLSGVDPRFAQDGPMGSGRLGLYDVNTSTSTAARRIDNVSAWALPSDAAIFGGKSLIIGDRGVVRADQSGPGFSRPKYEGRYLRLPPAGREGRKSRFLIKSARRAPGLGNAGAANDLSASLVVTPRTIAIPPAV